MEYVCRVCTQCKVTEYKSCDEQFFLVKFTTCTLWSKVYKTKIYSAINQLFSLCSRVGDMDLWNEVKDELALMFSNYNSPP